MVAIPFYYSAKFIHSYHLLVGKHALEEIEERGVVNLAFSNLGHLDL